MSSISMDVPTFKVNKDDLENLMKFIYQREHILNEYGALKIQLDNSCCLALKKRSKDQTISTKNNRCLMKGRNDLFYTVNCFDRHDRTSIENSIVSDETTFWSSLSTMRNNPQPLNSLLIPNKSFFYCKASRKLFDIHVIPSQSLLRIGKRKVIQECKPCVKRAYGSNAIFPLRSARQNLFTIDYHHEGGNHHWFVIPTRERKELQEIIPNHCFDHGQVFIHPSLLDKHQIRYHRIIQKPNEFVILAAGTLAQSFTENASWSEFIEFALPSWIQDGHAHKQNKSCLCEISDKRFENIIDVNTFRPVLIKKYIKNYLTKTNDDKLILCKDDNDLDMIILQTPNSLINDSMHVDNTFSAHTEIPVLQEKLESISQLPILSLRTPTLSIGTLKDDDNQSNIDNSQVYYELIDQGSFPPVSMTTLSDISIDDLVMNESLLDADDRTKEFCCNNTPFTSLFGDITYDHNLNDRNLSYEELMELLPFDDDIFTTSDESVASVRTTSTSVSSQNSTGVGARQLFSRSSTLRRTLFVSELRPDVSKINIMKQFPDCIKVTIKRSHSLTDLRYAFVLHRTCSQAKRNLYRPINRLLLGPNCRVEFANNRSFFSTTDADIRCRKVVVTRIPPNIDEFDLKYLFVGCQISKYSPARVISRSAGSVKPTNAFKVLTGFAFLLFNTEQEAADVIKHADRYQLHGESLVISPYRY
ncbi:hypothetical protein I4U23_030313 [Adineta vaga]|nr:hypothetical protein I4U23_030313 [Adineta vaga]